MNKSAPCYSSSVILPKSNNKTVNPQNGEHSSITQQQQQKKH